MSFSYQICPLSVVVVVVDAIVNIKHIHLFLFIQNALRQVWLKLAQCFWRRIFLKNLLLFFRYYLPLENDRTLHLNESKFSSSKDAFYQVWLKLAQWFCRGTKCKKKFTTMTIDNRKIVIKPLSQVCLKFRLPMKLHVKKIL